MKHISKNIKHRLLYINMHYCPLKMDGVKN